MESLEKVPVITVTKDNLKELWPLMLQSLRNCSFMAIDLELSGLGSKKGLHCKQIEDRYQALVEVTKTRAIIAFGLSCFELTSDGETQEQPNRKYKVTTFNIMVLIDENYVVEPDGLQFLVNHGFDFNLQYTKGVPYYRGNDKPNDKNTDPSLRKLFMEIILSRKSIVLHNGFIDLLFLYQNLYCDLPSNIQTFAADLSQMAPGFYDTKHISESGFQLHPSYLEYMFKKRLRWNQNNIDSDRPALHVEFVITKQLNSFVEFRSLAIPHPSLIMKAAVCKFFAEHGWCKKGLECTDSHDVDSILHFEDVKKAKKKRKRDKKTNSVADMTPDTSGDESVVPTYKQPNSTSSHRAGFDAFMTGFAFATFLVQKNCGNSSGGVLNEEWANKMNLGGKVQPLLIQKGNFANYSPLHTEKLKKYVIPRIT